MVIDMALESPQKNSTTCTSMHVYFFLELNGQGMLQDKRIKTPFR